MDVRAQLHDARIARQLTLEDLAARTALSPAVIARMDAGEFESLPAGIYARAYVRAFAREVGLDPVRLQQDLEPCLPPAPDPFPLLRSVRTAPEGTLHLQLARATAAVLDAVVLLATVVLPILGLASWSSGADLRTLLMYSGGELGLLCALPVALYFLLFDGIGGATPGWRAVGLLEVEAGPPLRLHDILRRAVSH